MSVSADPPNVNPEVTWVLAEHGWRLRPGTTPRQMGGGFWAEMWRADLADNETAVVVVRLAPDAGLSKRESLVQRCVATLGYPTPAVLADGVTPHGQAYSVMECAEGAPLLSGLSGIRALRSIVHLARHLPVQLAEASAALHRLDPDACAEALVAHGWRSDIDGLVVHYSDVADRLGDRDLQARIDHLRRTAPPAERAVICHGDLHPFNLLDDDGRITVVDWTAARIAPPAFDLAFTNLLLSNPPLSAPALARPPITGAARWLARRFLREYERRCGEVDASQLHWFHQLHVVRVLSDIAQWRADGTLDDHLGHPWLQIEAALRSGS